MCLGRLAVAWRRSCRRSSSSPTGSSGTSEFRSAVCGQSSQHPTERTAGCPKSPATWSASAVSILLLRRAAEPPTGACRQRVTPNVRVSASKRHIAGLSERLASGFATLTMLAHVGAISALALIPRENSADSEVRHAFFARSGHFAGYAVIHPHG